MRHRHHPDLKPTDRLVIAALKASTEPLSVAELAEASGAAPSTLTRTVRVLAKRGLIVRHRIGGLSNFTLPADTVINERALATNNTLIKTRVADRTNLPLPTAIVGKDRKIANLFSLPLPEALRALRAAAAADAADTPVVTQSDGFFHYGFKEAGGR